MENNKKIALGTTLGTVGRFAEEHYEGFDGDTEFDKQFWIHGFTTGYFTKEQELLDNNNGE